MRSKDSQPLSQFFTASRRERLKLLHLHHQVVDIKLMKLWENPDDFNLLSSVNSIHRCRSMKRGLGQGMPDVLEPPEQLSEIIFLFKNLLWETRQTSNEKAPLTYHDGLSQLFDEFCMTWRFLSLEDKNSLPAKQKRLLFDMLGIWQNKLIDMRNKEAPFKLPFLYRMIGELMTQVQLFYREFSVSLTRVSLFSAKEPKAVTAENSMRQNKV